MDMRETIQIAEGLFGFGKKEAQPPAPTGHASMTATLASGHGIRWHKESDPAARKLVWHGKFQAGDLKKPYNFMLRAEPLTTNGDWKYSLQSGVSGYVIGVVANEAAEKASKGLLLMCESLKPATVSLGVTGNLQEHVIGMIRQMLPQFRKVGYKIDGNGRLARAD